MKLLEKTHKGKIDFIYIDPPYNTKNKDFIYNDTRICETDEYKHSKWLSFMEKRLSIARTLLSDDGVIFISIDDHECANLILLCNDIFGENNFVENLIWRKKNAGANNANQFATLQDYILVYCKNKKNFPKLYEPFDKEYLNRYNEKDEKGFYFWDTYGRSNGRPIELTTPNGEKTIVNAMHSQENVFKMIQDGELSFYKNKKGCWGLKIKQRLNSSGKKPKSIIWDLVFNQHGTEEIRNIFNTKSTFLFPKPTILIKYLLGIINKKNCIVLDFFAGSGTTGQAVLELNKEDGGNRKFILCTNNENNICTDITYPRIKTIITGLRKNGSKYSNGIPVNLKYFKTNLIPKDTEDLEDELLEASIPLIELENFISLDDATIKVIFNEEELEVEIKNIDTNTKIFYIAEDIILSNTQKEILIKNNIELKRIPKYYYKNEM